jgi:hypothetical protein
VTCISTRASVLLAIARVLIECHRAPSAPISAVSPVMIAAMFSGVHVLFMSKVPSVCGAWLRFGIGISYFAGEGHADWRCAY